MGQKNKRAAVTGALVLGVLVCAGLVGHLEVRRNAASSTMGEKSAKEVRMSEGFSGFVFVSEEKTWDQAQTHCLQLGGVLATVDSEEKMNKMTEISGGVGVWIGFRTINEDDPTDTSQYRWESGANSAGYTNWDSDQPNNDAGYEEQYCTEQMPTQLWNNLECDGRKRAFVCDKSPYVLAYAMHGVNGDGYTFDEANTKCYDLYGTGLATLADPDLMVHVMSETQTEPTWVGLRISVGATHSAGNFQNSNGNADLAELNWNAGEPDNAGGVEYCAHIEGEDAVLTDVDCKNRLNYFLCDQ